MTTNLTETQYRVTGMDCASCAKKIENVVRKFAEVETIHVSTASQIMTLTLSNPDTVLPKVESAVQGIGYKLSQQSSSEGDGLSDQPHVTSSYRRALYIVVFLNVGYGLIEMVGGYIAGSQALKADALDFLGDGLITFLGVLAIGWSLAWRAKSALMQGIFLGLLGLGVIANTVYRIVVMQTPEPELMGILGVIALVVNIIAAAALLPHRTGDANVRAVWLFSRNDAIGNLAIVISAGLVFWTGSPIPDLVVAIVIAGLFLHASLVIIRDARNDLKTVAKKT